MNRAGFPLTMLALTFTALSARPAGAQEEAVFLGMVVADSVTHESNGALVLTGIHQVTRVKSFPHTENLSVYTRWGGSGAHDIGISIWNSDTDETVAETEQTVTFSDTGATTFIWAFPATVFPHGGTYDVEATLDGDIAADYTLFENGGDSYPDTPELILSVPAEKAALDRTGSASVSGIPDAYSFPGFPAQNTFDLVTLWFSGDSGHQQHMEILDPTGVPIAASPPESIPAGPGRMSLMTDSFRDVPLAVRGTYTAVLYLDGEDVLEYPLSVVRQ